MEPARTAPQVLRETLLPLYASHFLLTGNDEHLIVDCAPAVMADPQSGKPALPIHTRLVLSWSGAERLAAMLAQALQKRASLPTVASRSQTTSPSNSPDALPAAQLPKLDA